MHLAYCQLLFQTAFTKPEMSRDAVDKVVTLERVLKSYNKSLLSPLSRKLAHAAARSTPNLIAPV